MSWKFEIAENIETTLHAFIEQGLDGDACQKGVPVGVKQPLAISMRDTSGALTAGLEGYSYNNWLFVHGLYVKNQNQGIGTAILKAAEREALSRGCHGIYLWTLSISAPNFYERLGFQKFGEIPDYPNQNCSLMGYRKSLISP